MKPEELTEKIVPGEIKWISTADFLQALIDARISAAVLAERERCANIADEYGAKYEKPTLLSDGETRPTWHPFSVLIRSGR